MRKFPRIAAATASVVAVVLLAAGCGSSDGPTLTLYNAQHRELMKTMAEKFEDETGVKVELRNGSDFELANQIVQEGENSPADLFTTENSPAMSLVDSKGLFQYAGDQAVNNVAVKYVSASKNWVGFAARATVLPYNPTKLTEADLPKSILDLADPKWKGRFGISAGGADFQAIVSAVMQLNGEEKTKTWLAGLKENAKLYQGNIPVMKAVNAGEIDAGIIYHYYWFRDQAEAGANSNNVKLHYLGNKDAGAFISTSGVGVLKSSKHTAEAQQFVSWLNGPTGQKMLAESTGMEYAVGNGAQSNPKLKPLSEIDSPLVDMGSLNGPRVIELMQQAGLL